MKVKYLTKNQIIISIDRLTRLKAPEIKYLRVFNEIILNNLLEPKYKKCEIDALDYETIKNLAEFVINESVRQITKIEPDYSINRSLREYEESIFNIDSEAKILLDNKINYSAIVSLLSEDLTENLKFLKSLSTDKKYNGLFPVRKLVLTEGITEEILLPQFAKICGYDFLKNGVYIISAGGKNQVVKYFYNYAKILKIPVFVLLDSDADDNYKQIVPKLREFDKIHLLKSGEFEDLLPHKLILKTLNYSTHNISLPLMNINEYPSTVKFLEEYYRHRGLHEFKKSEFAYFVRDNIEDISDVSDEIKEILNEIKLINNIN